MSNKKQIYNNTAIVSFFTVSVRLFIRQIVYLGLFIILVTFKMQKLSRLPKLRKLKPSGSLNMYKGTKDALQERNPGFE